MTNEEIVKHTRKIIEKVDGNYYGSLAAALEFIRTFGGKDNKFLKALDIPYSSDTLYLKYRLNGVLTSFADYVENGLLRTITLEREIQIETVSDYLEQARTLLKNKKVHPAAPAVIIGSSLEEFLRNWLEELDVDMSKMKLNLESYSQKLRKMNLLTKQDVKDLTSWGGIRNDAAHGHWTNVEDRNRINIMLEGVNLFMRKYGKSIL